VTRHIHNFILSSCIFLSKFDFVWGVRLNSDFRLSECHCSLVNLFSMSDFKNSMSKVSV
jgi:hypothetical protein